MPTPVIILLAVAIPLVAFIVLIVRKGKSRDDALDATLDELGLSKTETSPLRAKGTVGGVAVSYEHVDYRSPRSGQFPMVRVRVTGGGESVPDAALLDRLWDGVGRTVPTGMAVLETGIAALDERFEAHQGAGSTASPWAAAMQKPDIAALLSYEGMGRVREVTLFAGQVTVLAGREVRGDRQRQLIEGALALAGILTTT